MQPSSGTKSSVAADSVSRSTPRLWFITEIQQMMYGLGDCRKPLVETAALVEEIVYRQVTEILYLAEEVGRQRNSRFIGIEEFLFLLRRNKTKLKRLLRYIDFKDLKSTAVKSISAEDDDVEEETVRQPLKKRRKVCQEFFTAIDDSGELLTLLDDNMEDEIKKQRKMRAELMTRNMDRQQYMEFCEARQASFCPKYRSQKFNEWLLSGAKVEIKPNQYAIEILSYLAYEIVAEIVDLALIVKRDMNATVDDPFSLEMAPVSYGLSVLASQPSGDSPSALTNSNSPESDSSSQQSSLFKNRAQLKNKKQPVSQMSRDLQTGNAITPSEVREALRRYSQSIGPFADSSVGVLLDPVAPCGSCSRVKSRKNHEFVQLDGFLPADYVDELRRQLCPSTKTVDSLKKYLFD